MRRISTFAVLVALALTTACKGAASTESAPSAELKTEDEKTLYALGVVVGRNLGQFHLSPAELEIVSRGVGDAASGRKPLVEIETFGPKVEELARARAAAGAEVEKKKAADFVEKAAGETGATRTPSGLVYRSLKPGTGPSPTAADTVRVHYEGTFTDGSVFDSSVKRGQPVEFPLTGVIPCWTEGVQRMKVGEKAKLVCPSDIAYGDRGRPPTIPGGATLVFEVELLEIKK